ncbi:MAG: DUF2339 domain-containing protein [Stagnimonas sp.]|nr:DUF2339 domain-containing protein [Stagnimonas sp.]
MNADDTRTGKTPLIFAVIGFFVGMATGSNGGFLLGALAGWALGLAWAQQGVLRRLQARIEGLERARWQSAGAVDAPAKQVAPAAVLPVDAAQNTVPAAPVPTPVKPLPEPSTWVPLPQAPPNAIEKGIVQAWDWLRGGNPLAKIGVVILFFGAVFLVKYAAEHSLFPIELRFVGLGAGAVALLVIGWRLRTRTPGYAQILQGGGIAGLYLVTFAAARLYHLVPLPFALAVMVAVAVLAALLAVAQNALAMAVIGTGGGFLAPLLVSTGSGNHIALFTYYAILNLGVFTVAWFRAWRVLNLLGLLFTFGIVGVFRGTGYEAEKLISTDAFVLLFFGMYVAVSILFALRQKPDLKGAVSASLVFGLPVAAFGIHASLWRGTEYALAWSALGFGAFYIVLATVLWNRQREHLRLLCEAFAALGVIFTSLAVPLAFDEHATAAMWAVEGAGLMWLGVKQDRKLARAFSVLLQVGGTLAFLKHGMVAAEALPIANSQCIGLLVLGVSALLSGHWLRREGQTLPAWEQSWSLLAILAGTLWISLAGLGEISRVLESVEAGATLAWLSLLALVWQALSRRLAWPLFDHLAIALMAVAAVLAVQLALHLPTREMLAAWDDSMQLSATQSVLPHPASLAGWLGWPLWCLVQYRLLWRREPDAPLLFAQHLATGLLLLTLLIWEATWQVQAAQPLGFWQWLPGAALLIATLALLTRATLKPAWPLAGHAQAYRLGVGWPVAAASALWLVLANASSVGSAAPLPTWPLLNPLDLASIGLLLALTRYGLQPAAREHLSVQPRVLLVGLAALVFLWMNAALVRGLHYGIDTPLFGQGALHSTVLQAALSVFWSLLAFAVMVFASRKGLRVVWLAGAALMAVVVVKLFVIDTAGSGTLARIVAFFSVGGILLVTGYFSPLPPAVVQDEAEAA